VAGRAAVAQAGADALVERDVADAVFLVRPLSLPVGELALKELAPAANRAERVAGDDVCGGTTTFTFPRPVPTSSDNDLLMPALIGFVACVLSIIWAWEGAPPSASAGATSAMALNQGFMVNPSSSVEQRMGRRAWADNGERLKIGLSQMNSQAAGKAWLVRSSGRRL
jgi:hypothetical protein